jgi:hypothetical protein
MAVPQVSRTQSERCCTHWLGDGSVSAGADAAGRRKNRASAACGSFPFLKAAMNAAMAGQVGRQLLAGDSTMGFYMSEEGQLGRNASVEKRPVDFSKYP